MIKISVDCTFCKEEQEVVVDAKGYEKHKNGELIQNAMPNLSPEKRELLISGICPKCWDNMF